MNRSISFALLLGGLGMFQATHAQTTTSQACGAGELLVKSSTERVDGRDVDTECTGVSGLLENTCSGGQILQRGHGALHCADNNDVVPGSATDGGGTSSQPGCRLGYLVTGLTDDGRAESCKYIEDVLGEATANCADGSVLRVSNGALYCGDYLGTGSLTALPTTAASSTNCGDGQVMQRNAAGAARCVSVAAVVAAAFPNCGAHETIVFDDNGVPGCGGPTACEKGQLAVLTSEGTQCRNVADALSGLCEGGQILQKGGGIMQCAANDGAVPTGTDVPGSTETSSDGQSSSTTDDDVACDTHEVATRQADGSIACTNIGQLIDTITSPCRNGHLLRIEDADQQPDDPQLPDDDTLRCNDYGNLNPTDILADAPVHSAAEHCAAGQVLRFTASGLQCENLATILEEAYECGTDETLVFGSDGAASCGRALTTCSADSLTWMQRYWTCRADAEESDIGEEQVFTDDMGATEGMPGAEGSATFACIWPRGTDGTDGQWSGPSGVVQCGEDPLLCPRGELAKRQGYQCATVSPGGNWKELPQSAKYCMDEFYISVDNASSCYALIGTPGGLAKTSTTDTSVTLTWNTVDHADSYLVEQYANANCTGALVEAFNAHASQRTVSGLEAGKEYYFLVRANRHGVPGDGSTCLSVSTPVTPPSKPGNLRVESAMTTSLVLNWDASVSQYGRILQYEVRQYSDANCTQDERSHGFVTQTTATVSRLTPDTTHYFTVQATDLTNDDGTPDARSASGWHTCTPGTTTPLTHCPAGPQAWTAGGNAGPQAVTASGNICRDDVPQTAVGTANVTLTDGAGRNVDAPELQGTATVQCTTKGWRTPSGAPATTCERDRTLCPASSTVYRCRATTPGTNWQAMPESLGYCTTAQNTCFVYVPPPMNLESVSVGDHHITMQWNSVPGASRYHVNRYDNNNCSGTPSTITVTEPSHAFTGLTEDTAYSFKVATERGGVKGSQYTSCVPETTSLTRPSQPMSLHMHGLSPDDTSIIMKWNPSTSISGRPVTYIVERYDNDDCSGTGATPKQTTDTQLRFDQLVPGNSYSFRVRASNLPNDSGGWDSRGDSNWHDCVAVSSTVNAPSMPGNLRVAVEGYRSITMRWDASTSPDGRPLTYTLTRHDGDDCTGTGVSEETPFTELAASDLTPATSYSFKVRASDLSDGSGGWNSDGDSAQTTCVSTATTWTPPPVPNSVFDADVGDVVLWKDRKSGAPGIGQVNTFTVYPDQINVTDFRWGLIPNHLFTPESDGGHRNTLSHTKFTFNGYLESTVRPEESSPIWINLGGRTSSGRYSPKELVDEDNRAFCFRLVDGEELGPQIYVPLAGKDDEYAFTLADIAAMDPPQTDAHRAIEAWAAAGPTEPYLDAVLVALGPGFDASTLSVVEPADSDTDSDSDSDSAAD